MRVTTLECDAQDSLDAALESVFAGFSRVPATVSEATLMRIEVPVPGELSVAEALRWSATASADARAFWADRAGTLIVAGIGEAWTVGGLGWTLGDGLQSVQSALAAAPGRLRAVGGLCFHRELRSRKAWKAFGAWRFAVPLVELGRDSDGVWIAAHVHGSPADWTRNVAAAKTTVASIRDATSSRGVDAARLDANGVDAAGAEGEGGKFERGADSESSDAGAPTIPLEVVDTPTRAGWRVAVEDALARIQAGALQKVVLARQRRVQLDRAPDPIELLARLADQEPHAYRFCLQPTAESAFVGASPERLVRVDGGAVFSEALAGTRPRGDDTDEEVRWGAELLASEKDRREHQLVTEMVAGTLRELCDSVEVPEAPTVMTLARVQHLHTPIRAASQATPSIAALLLALHPTPAVGGTPREEARLAIEALECFQRGLYAAPVGWIGGQGSAEFTVAIRSALVEGDAVSLFSGAGVVEGSDPDDEWAEIDGKIAALWQAFGLDGETP